MNFKKAIFNSSIGNILEWYDFGLFAIFSPLFSRLFFPTADLHASLIATFGIFAIGFFCRPVGALIFGYLGDTQGRAKTLRLSILMIAVPTLIVGLLPTYQKVGMLAPMLLLLIRMWQGICIGGEYSGNLIYLSESAPPQHRATCTSFASAGSNLGILLAAIMGSLCSYSFSETTLADWGWRLPYLVSGIFSLLMYQFRLRLDETRIFQQLKNDRRLVTNPVKVVFKNNLNQLLRTVCLVCMGSTFYYFIFVYLPFYLSQNKSADIYSVSTLMTCFVGAMILLVPVAGYICDRIGKKKMLLFNATLIICIVIPGFYWLQGDSLLSMIMVLLMFTLASSLEQGTTPVVVVETFPPEARYTGVSLGYNLGNGLLGGTVPMICEWLSVNTATPLAPAIYIVACAALTGLVVLLFVPDEVGMLDPIEGLC